MRTLSTITIFVLLSSANLTAQIIPPTSSRKPAAEVSGIYLVTFRPGVPAALKAAAVQASGARGGRGFNASNTASVEVPDAAALTRLRNDPRVLSVFATHRITLSVQGRGGGGNSAASRPKAPTSLGGTAISPNQINLAWTDASDNESGFAVERCTGSACSNFSEIFRTNANGTTYGDSGLTAQTLYRYRVLAFNAAGSSKYSNIAEVTTLAAPPSAPTNLISSAPSYNQVNLNWSDNSTNENGFRIERCTGAG